MKKPDLILGISVGYDFKDLAPFFVSLRRTGYAGNVSLFTRDMDAATGAILRKLGVELYNFTYSAQDDDPLTVTGGRFFLFQKFLAEYGHKFENVMLTDVRDVIFQLDPFGFEIGDSVCCFQEDCAVRLGGESMNASWVRQAYGEDALAELDHACISCVGSVIGSARAVAEYVKTLNTQLSAIRPDFFGSDQAAHNYALGKGLVPNLKMFSNDHGPVMTLGLKKTETIRLDRENRVVNDLGDVVRVLHQYDRHPALNELMLEKYA